MNIVLKLTLKLATFSDKIKKTQDFYLLSISLIGKAPFVLSYNDLDIVGSELESWKVIRSFFDMAKDGIIEAFHQITLLLNNRVLGEDAGMFIVDVSRVLLFLMIFYLYYLVLHVFLTSVGAYFCPSL
jgi:hypothetical protein